MLHYVKSITLFHFVVNRKNPIRITFSDWFCYKVETKVLFLPLVMGFYVRIRYFNSNERFIVKVETETETEAEAEACV